MKIFGFLKNYFLVINLSKQKLYFFLKAYEFKFNFFMQFYFINLNWFLLINYFYHFYLKIKSINFKILITNFLVIKFFLFTL